MEERARPEPGRSAVGPVPPTDRRDGLRETALAGNPRCHERVEEADPATHRHRDRNRIHVRHHARHHARHRHRSGEVAVLFLVVALLLLGLVVGAAAYLPWPLTLVLGSLIAVWLVVFAGRERRRRNRTRRA
ncbi:hypothetical protein GCM10018980_13430 [Streptomyces capoamus]|uniref:Uncharacterized protein n=1 Tax=Streptomyces capoamus TaxID=68183 RepID=A0A919C0V3_9ACTN|nr:hypothetical protein GCM10010501_21030 [Streptomyces libani subsp. rufus]GHG39734.1 hypothetical protein GCM10018980_13430 [Streptomyces capoamus]